MSGDDGYKYQMSIKFGPNQVGMLNIRADTADEFVEKVNAAITSVGPAAVLVEAYNTEFQAVSAVASAFPATTVATGGYAAPSAGGEMCKHGAMAYKEGPDWKGWFCPAQKSDPTKCKAKYIR